jgi:PAS domain S-box-containing protein
MTEKQNMNILIRTDQIEQLYTRIPFVALWTLIISTIVAIIQWPVINHSVLLLWWGVMVLITTVRWLLAVRFRKTKIISTEIETWATIFFIGTVCAGLAWGAGGFFLFPEQNLAHQLVLIVVIAGMASAGVTTLAYWWSAILTFLCLMLIPLVIRMFLMGSGIYLIIGGLIVLFLGGLILSAHHLKKTFSKILTLKVKSMQQAIELQESEERHRHLIENASDLIYETDENGHITFFNNMVSKITGYSKKELIGKHYLDFVRSDYREKLKRFYIIQFIKKIPSTYQESPSINKHGKEIWLGQSVQLLIKDNRIIGFQSVARDITKRKLVEEALKESEEKFRTISTSAQDAIIMINNKGNISFWNEAAEKMFGYSFSEVLRKEGLTFFMPQRYHTAYREGFIKYKTTGRGEVIDKILELVAVRKDGIEIPIELSVSSIKLKGAWNTIGIIRDITNRKRSEDKIKVALKEKEILLKEIHHRVKNNLQTIISLLNLQSGYIKDKQALRVFKNSQERVKAMALIHEKLYKSTDLAKINFQEYVGGLISYLFDSYSLPLDQVQLKLKIEDIVVDIETAIPLGLLINELFSNSLKHAFPEKRKGELRVELGKSDEEEFDCKLVVADNGVGFPENLNLQDSNTLGLVLVETLVKQMHGVLDIEKNDGTKFIIKFNRLKKDKDE